LIHHLKSQRTYKYLYAINPHTSNLEYSIMVIKKKLISRLLLFTAGLYLTYAVFNSPAADSQDGRPIRELSITTHPETSWKAFPTIETSETAEDSVKGKKGLEFVHITKTGGSAIEKAGAKQGLIWGACHYMEIPDVGCFAPDMPYTAPNYQSYALTSPWHTPPKLLKEYVNATLYPYDDADLFAVIRNPYDRAISEYYCPWVGFQAKFRNGSTHDKDPNDPVIMNFWVKSMVTSLAKSLDEFNEERKEGKGLKVQKEGLNEDESNLAQKHYVNQVEYVYDGDKVIIKNLIHYENLSKEFDALMEEYGLNFTLPLKEKGGTYADLTNKKRLSHLDLTPETIAVINEFAKRDFDAFGYQMVDKFEKGQEYSMVAKKLETAVDR